MTKQIWLTIICLSLTIGLMAQEKIPINRADQLPRRVINLKTPQVLELLGDGAEMAALSQQIQQNLLADLDSFDIQDAATLKDYYSALADLALMAQDLDRAEIYIELQRELIEKESEALMHGQSFYAIQTAFNETGTMGGAAFEDAYATAYFDNLNILPFELIRDRVEAAKGQVTLMTENILFGQIQGQFQPMIDNMEGVVPERMALSILNIGLALDLYMPLREAHMAVYDSLLRQNPLDEAAMVNIWRERSISLQNQSNLTPVVVGIWDSGVDTEVFGERARFTNSKEQWDGQDNDKNGHIDDIHGIAYDKDYHPSSSLLLLPDDLTYSIDILQLYIQGLMDLRANISSPAADSLLAYTQSLSVTDFQAFTEDMSWYGLYSHGTHVAGIALDGNPMAKVLTARFAYSTKTIPDAPSLLKSERTAQAYRDIVKYFKANGVRVVNMSWGYNVDFFEASLAANNIGDSVEARQILAQQMFQIERNALYEAIEGAPDILFVAAAGNSNNDVDFAATIPSGFNLPNLITVGAVNTAGEKTSFTTEGKSVDFYANGFEVESYVPGGDRVSFSGTSMAAPQVVNLAAKLFAIYPDMATEEVIRLIQEWSDESDEGILLINPRKTVQYVQKNLGGLQD